MIAATRSLTTERVERVRALMAAEGLDAVVVRSTDRYLNEYVPKAESTRIWLTGFTGSMGEALLTRDQAWLAVDGRYYLQADAETAGTPFSVERVPLGTSLSKALLGLIERGLPAEARSGARAYRVGYESDRFALKELELFQRTLEPLGATLVPTLPSLVERARGELDVALRPLRVVPAAAVGLSVGERVAAAAPALKEQRLAALVVLRLDELAYLTNLRGDDLPYQSTFRGIGLLRPDAVVLGLEGDRLPAGHDPALRVVPAARWLDGLERGARVGYDPDGATPAVLDALRARGLEPVALPSPLVPMKARKTAAELAAMRSAFARADRVVEQAIDLVAARLAAGQRMTEADLAAEVERLFRASGATGLSFRVIAAAGPNGAVIHYSDPDPERELREGELVLLDTGAYYAEGYATDLTRTFLAGAPERVPAATAEQRRMFTCVLRAAIAGMSARLPRGGRGDQLDAIVRAPLWAEGLDFNHGTGHGVGINVHEAPPRVSTAGNVALEPGHVFSIEPGLYLPGTGGVRIENLCTVVASERAPGFLDVEPLTFARLDERLIDRSQLGAREAAWLDGYMARGAEAAAGR